MRSRLRSCWTVSGPHPSYWMREVDRSHGQMKSEGGGGKVSALRTMPPSIPGGGIVKSLSFADGCDDPSVKAMWDEEFFGHELPPNFKISRVKTPDSLEKKQETNSSRRDVMVERAMWDEEYVGHRLPPNYTISRFRTPEALEKKKQDKPPSGLNGSNRHTRRGNPEDTFEYNFDKTVDTYVLSEVPSRGRGVCVKDEWDGIVKPEAQSTSLTGKHDCVKVETFEERALRFGVEDWNLFSNRKWSQYECHNNSKGGSKRSSARRGIFHSPTGSDTSSMISTFESSSFSCGSEGSSFAKTDLSSSSFNLSYLYATSSSLNPLSAEGHCPSGFPSERSGEEQFVEFDILDTVEKLDSPVAFGQELINKNDAGTFFEFNFLDGNMVESSAVEGITTISDITEERSTEGVASASKSPDSESFFDSSNESDWSGTHSSSTIDLQGNLMLTRETETIFFDEDNASNFTEDRGTEEWGSDHHYYDVDSSFPQSSAPPPPSTSSTIGVKGQGPLADAEGTVAAGSALISRSGSSSGRSSAASAASKLCSDEKKSTSRSPSKSPSKKIQGVSRKTRSLGSVLSHHLAFTALPTLRHNSQPSVISEQKETPSKVSAACIEWLWSEKEAMKPVQALRALAERENAERDRIGSSPPLKGGDHLSTREESRTFGLGKSQHVFSRNAGMDSNPMKRAETSPFNSSNTLPAHRESRDSIIASWAAIYGTGGSERHTFEAARAVKRPSTPTSKVSFSATSLKHTPVKAGASPRKRSASFGAQAGCKAVTSALAKQPPVPKSLALELEVLCRPFGPVLKGVRLLPTAKRGLGRPPLFSNLGPQLASSTSSSSIPPVSMLKCGRMQCVVSRDGLPSYSLIMDETEEIFVAKSLRVDAGLQEGVSHVYTFHSYKGKGKGKSGWRQWGKKEKPGSDFAGNMTVTSCICPLSSSSGMQNFVESEFVLFDSKIKDMSVSGPTSTSPYPRSSISSWDTATPQRSPQQGVSPSFSSPNSAYYSLPSPSGGLCSTPVSDAAGATAPTRQISIPGTLLTSGASRVKQLERHMNLTSPLHPGTKSSTNSGFPESNMSDSETADDLESRCTGAALSLPQSEIAAVVVRTPFERSQGKAAPSGDKWGWGINFLRKSFDGSKSFSSPDHSAASSGDSPMSKDRSPGSCSTESSRSSTDQRFASTSADEQSNGGLNVTLILPSGEHGCSANGIDGPQPLIDRWRAGGKCDCGSWDLGCGLTVVGNQYTRDTVEAPVKGQLRDDALRLFVEGKKQETVGLALTPLKEGCFSLGFQAPISPLHAFATAVAVLHSRDPIISSKKTGEAKKRLTRIPVKVVPASRSFSRQTEDTSGSRGLVGYKLVCPDPPSSPFGRA